VDKGTAGAARSWLFVGMLIILCLILGALQYRWIGELSRGAHERLRASLQASLHRLSQDFNAEIAAACRSLLPAWPEQVDEKSLETAVATQYARWKKNARNHQMFSRVAVATARDGKLQLQNMDLGRCVFQPALWPPAWKNIKDRLEFRLSPPWENRSFRPPPLAEDGLAFEIPLAGRPSADSPSHPLKHLNWLILELDLDYVRHVLLPELIQHHLAPGGRLVYEVAVLSRVDPSVVIYRSDPHSSEQIARSADASVNLFEPVYPQLFHLLRVMGSREHEAGLAPTARRPWLGRGRWEMFVRHKAGSLEAVVARTRWRNLAVTACVLFLMVITVAALVRYTRHAQRLAELQMVFVAGVSHELRTPLTIIQTAAYNLRTHVATSPGQVERYGELIEQESQRLKELVEQIMRFAGLREGCRIHEPQPLSVGAIIDEAVESSKALIQTAQCVVEKTVDPDLPPILGDPVALKHVFGNLLSNAVKYGTDGSNWIGIAASCSREGKQPVVEVRVTDRGPGIPEDEQRQVFEPFYRGRQALQAQIHGTGLGLSLAKKIIEAHGGSIRVHSGLHKGTEFIVRIPAMRKTIESEDETSHSTD